jgi:phage host-nuclease inhibitor protein Gam
MRVKKKVVANVTSELYNDQLARFAAANAKQASITARMDEAITKIREKYADELEELAKIQEEAFEYVKTYAEENQESLFTKKKSLETVHGVIGFRTGTPALKTEKGFTWASVLLLVKNTLPQYVRTKEEVNKEALLADRDELGVKMKQVGVRVEQEETFFIDLKKEEAVPAI